MGTEIRFYINRTGKDWKTEDDLPQFTELPKEKTAEAIEKWRLEFFKYIEDNCILTLWNICPIASWLRRNPCIKKIGDHYFGELPKREYNSLAAKVKEASDKGWDTFIYIEPSTDASGRKWDRDGIKYAAERMNARKIDWDKEKVYVLIM